MLAGKETEESWLHTSNTTCITLLRANVLQIMKGETALANPGLQNDYQLLVDGYVYSERVKYK